MLWAEAYDMTLNNLSTKVKVIRFSTNRVRLYDFL